MRGRAGAWLEYVRRFGRRACGAYGLWQRVMSTWDAPTPCNNACPGLYSSIMQYRTLRAPAAAPAPAGAGNGGGGERGAGHGRGVGQEEWALEEEEAASGGVRDG